MFGVIKIFAGIITINAPYFIANQWLGNNNGFSQVLSICTNFTT